MGMIDAVKIMRDAELKAESNKITLGEYEAMIRPLRQVMTKADYETRLKADMVAMLTDIQLEIEELRLDRPLFSRGYECYGFEDKTPTEIQQECSEIIQQKINALNVESKDTKEQNNE